MSILRKLVTPFADDIMVKLMDYKDFPEEKYEIVIENRKLREELLVSKSKHYDYLLTENVKMRDEIDKLREDKMNRLELENNMLKLELSRTGNNQFLLADSSEKINPLNITKFIYAGNLFKYFYDDNTVRTKLMKESEFLDVVNSLFPDGKINIVGNELHIGVYKNSNFLGNLILDLNVYNRVSEIDDWIEDKLTSHNNYGNRGDSFELFSNKIDWEN